MSGNTFGKLFKITTFGESHGAAMGCILDGCPPQIELTKEDIQRELDKRKPWSIRRNYAKKRGRCCRNFIWSF